MAIGAALNSDGVFWRKCALEGTPSVESTVGHPNCQQWGGGLGDFVWGLTLCSVRSSAKIGPKIGAQGPP